MMVRQTFVAASMLAALTMTAGAADMPVKAPRVIEQPQPVSGYVELYGGWTRSKATNCSVTCFSDEGDGWALGGAGRVSYWWAPNYSIQLDAQGDGASRRFDFGGGFSSRLTGHNYLIGGHANWRDPQRGLIGIFGGAGDATTTLISTGSNRHGLIGGEGQIYWGPVTLYGQVGYDSTLGQLSSGGVDSIQAWFVRGTGRVYVNPNFRLEGTVLFADGRMDFVNAAATNVDFETWLWRAKAEYKFAGSPFSMFAYYEGSQTKTTLATNTRKITDDRIMGGIRLYINENTLLWNDRNGTTLDIIAPHGVGSFIAPRTDIN